MNRFGYNWHVDIDPEQMRALARQLGKLPKARRYDQVCPVCGTSFKGTARAVYCSIRCKLRAYRQRKRDDTPSVVGDDKRMIPVDKTQPTA